MSTEPGTSMGKVDGKSSIPFTAASSFLKRRKKRKMMGKEDRGKRKRKRGRKCRKSDEVAMFTLISLGFVFL